MKQWEIIADNLHKAGWSYGYISALDRKGRTIWIVDAHRDGGVHAKELLTACVELELAIKVANRHSQDSDHYQGSCTGRDDYLPNLNVEYSET